MKHFIIIYFIIFLISLKTNSGLTELEPVNGPELSFDPEFIKKFNSPESFARCEKIWEKMAKEKLAYDDLSTDDKGILQFCDEMREDAWDIVGSGCSWYCGGGPDKITASSVLAPQGENTYDAFNAHDLSYRTAWVEGKKGYGIGEYLEYHFAPESPRINKIIVVNGYVKSKAAWQNNSRVKRLKMYVNGEPYAILKLNDVYAGQSFDVEPIGNGHRTEWEDLKAKPGWKLRFEILDVYKGLKYDDVAITEIYFDGLDVHCLAIGTKVKMANGLEKNIEDLNLGESILTMDSKGLFTNKAVIEKLDTAHHHHLIEYVFESGLKITATPEHPFLLAEKGWCSLQPKKSAIYKGFDNLGLIKSGDLFVALNASGELANEKLIEIKHLKGHQTMYTISSLNKGQSFIANGLVVGVEEMGE